MNNKIIWKTKQILTKELLLELDKYFNRLKIEFIPIKGAFLIQSNLSEKIEERNIGDVDILVKDNDLDAVTDFFSNEEKFKLKLSYKENYLTRESVFEYITTIGVPITVEFQSNISSSYRFMLPSEKIFKNSRKISNYMKIPNNEYALIILIAHAQSHIFMEIKPTLWKEIDLLISSKNFDFIFFRKESKKTGILPFFDFVLLLYGRKYKKKFHNFNPSLLAKIMAKGFSDENYKKKSMLKRRIFYDIPFQRAPIKGFLHKLSHGKVSEKKR